MFFELFHGFPVEIGGDSVFNRIMSNFDFYYVDANVITTVLLGFADPLKKFKKG